MFGIMVGVFELYFNRSNHLCSSRHPIVPSLWAYLLVHFQEGFGGPSGVLPEALGALENCPLAGPNLCIKT